MKNVFLFFILGILTISARADFELANNEKKVTCRGEDNIAIVLNAKRTTLSETWEGETVNTGKIKATETDNKTYIVYRSTIGELVLTDDGDVFLPSEDEHESYQLKCE